ncbi:ureidoglycolate lyase [Paracoccaceae bacterium]|nr:ureidoglycolate lyase [Paracoccaceae bacterium]
MSREISIEKLTAKKFVNFGDVVETKEEPFLINQNKCERHHDLVALKISKGGKFGVSVFSSENYSLPFELSLMERHPCGSQCFIPMSNEPFLVIVSLDENGRPGKPYAFVTNGQQGINYNINVWHSVLTPLSRGSLFAVIDRIGSGKNVEEYLFDEPWVLHSFK